MKVIITSGGTTEAIDRVRGITNHSTGYLGKIIAETLLEHGHEVNLVTTKHAVKPEAHPHLTIELISNVDSLIQTLEPLVATHDTLIHAMAVSDYTPVYMADFDQVNGAENLSQFLNASNQENKISSNSDYQVLFLKKTPKVISLVKEWNPMIQLIGFKLLVDVEPEELFAVARASLERNRADIIVANDLVDIKEGQHKAYLVSKDAIQEVQTKKEIAEALVERIEQ